MESVLLLIYLFTAVSVLYFITCILVNNFYIDRQDDIRKYPPVVTIYKNDEIIPCSNFINLSFSRPKNTEHNLEQQSIRTHPNSSTSESFSDEVVLNETNYIEEDSYSGLENIYSVGRCSSDLNVNHRLLEIMKPQNTRENSSERVQNSNGSCKSKKKSIKNISNSIVGNSSKDLKHVYFHKPSSTNIENTSQRKKSKNKLNMDEDNVEKELISHFPTCSKNCENHPINKKTDVSIVLNTNRPVKSTVGIKRKSPSNSKSNISNSHKIINKLSCKGGKFKTSKIVKSNNFTNENIDMTQSEESQMRAIEFDNKINELKNRCRNLVTDSDFTAELDKIGRGTANKINADISECVKECKDLAAKHNSREVSLERYNSNDNSYKGKNKLRSDIKSTHLHWYDKDGEESNENSCSGSTERNKSNSKSDSTNKRSRSGKRNAPVNDYDVSVEMTNNSNEPVIENVKSKQSSRAHWNCCRKNTDSESENTSDNYASNRRKMNGVVESNASLEMNIPSSRIDIAKSRRDQVKCLNLRPTNDRVTDSYFSVEINNIICPKNVDSSVSTEMGTMSYGTQNMRCQRNPKPAFVSESDSSDEVSKLYKPRENGTNKSDMITDPEISDGFKSRKIDQIQYTASEFSLELTKLCNTCNELINEQPFSLEEPLKTSTPKHSKRQTKLSAKMNKTSPHLKIIDNNLQEPKLTKQKFEEDLKDLKKKYFTNEVKNDVETNFGVLTMPKENQNKCVCTVVQNHISTSTTIIPYPNLQSQNNVSAKKIQAICSTIVSKRTESWMQTDPITNQFASCRCTLGLNNEPSMPAFRPEYNEKYPCTQKGLHEIFDSVLELHKQAEECLLKTKPSVCICRQVTKISESKLRKARNPPKSNKIKLKIKNKGSSTTTTRELGAGHSNKIRLRIVTKPKRKKHSDCTCPKFEIIECAPPKESETNAEQFYVPEVLMQSWNTDSAFRRSVSESRSKPRPCTCSSRSRTSCKCKSDNKTVLEILSEKVDNCLERAKNLMQEPKKQNVCECSRPRSESPRSRTSEYSERRSRSRSPKLSTKHVYLPDRDEITTKLYNKQHNIHTVPCPYLQSGSTAMGCSETNQSRSNSPSCNGCKCHAGTPKPTINYCRC